MTLLGTQCARCRRQLPPPVTVGLCECGGPRLPRYDVARLRRSDFRAQVESRPPGLLARWGELLPFADAGVVEAASMGETETPLVDAGPLGPALGLARLRLKLDLLLPSQSLKDRPHTAVVAAALANGARVVAVNSSGNAATALAAHANRVGMKTVVIVPAGSSQAKIDKARALGARVLQVEGSVDHAAAVLRVLVRRGGWFGAESWVNPFMVEGTKTIGLEIAVQSGWRAPDTVVLPLGNGAATLGPWKAFQELYEIGVIDRVPRIVGVQFAGCAPIAQAFDARADTVTPCVARPTLTTTLMIANPAVSGPLALAVLRATGGRAISVDDGLVREAMHLLAARAGLLVEPAGAISLAGVMRLAREGWIRSDEDVVALVSGAASNQPESMQLAAPPQLALAPGQEHEIDPAALVQ